MKQQSKQVYNEIKKSDQFYTTMSIARKSGLMSLVLATTFQPILFSGFSNNNFHLIAHFGALITYNCTIIVKLISIKYKVFWTVPKTLRQDNSLSYVKKTFCKMQKNKFYMWIVHHNIAINNTFKPAVVAYIVRACVKFK